MTVIHLKQHLESDTLYVPELRPLIGKQVEITVRELSDEESSAASRWQALAVLAGRDLIDPAVFEDYRHFDSQQQAVAP